MSQLEKMIQQLCPDGVEYKRLNAACKIFDGTHSTPDYKSEGIKFVSVENINNLYKTKKYISFEDYSKYKVKPQIDDILMTRIGSIGVCTVIEQDEPLAYYVSLALLRPDTMVFNSKYLKYAIESLHGRRELRKRTLVNAVPIKINKDDIGKITIPVPPLPVQQEIVRILDNFTELIAELTAELTARKKQYEYYRSQLLNFGKDIQFERLGNTCNMKSGKAIASTQISPEATTTHSYQCFGGNGVRGFVMNASHHGDFPIIGRQGALCGNVNYATGDFYATEHAVVVESKGAYLQRFLYYLLTSMNLNQYKSQGAQPGLAVGNLENLIAPVPPLDVQKYLVNVLDNFEAICSDLTIGLPAEIEARQKQYEYYRDKLLSFKELEV